MKRAPAAPIGHRPSAIAHSAAFSLVEILVVVALLSVIILGLVTMFGQTQRAFRTGMTQTDVLESGRMVSDLMRRELEQMTPTYLPRSRPSLQPNFFTWLPGYTPLVQPLPGSTRARTNYLEDVFFVFRRNQDWVGVGYFVRTRTSTAGALDWPMVAAPEPTVSAGTLYRFETNAPALSGLTPAQMFADFFYRATRHEALATKLLDGVVHLQIRAYDTNGLWIDRTLSTNIVYSAAQQSRSYQFYSNAVPAAVELELGVLEDRAWERFKAVANPGGQYRYLTNQAGRVHLFRLRVPVRNVDPDAYR